MLYLRRPSAHHAVEEERSGGGRPWQGRGPCGGTQTALLCLREPTALPGSVGSSTGSSVVLPTAAFPAGFPLHREALPTVQTRSHLEDFTRIHGADDIGSVFNDLPVLKISIANKPGVPKKLPR